MQKVILSFILCFALIQSAFAQQTVTGTVKDTDGLGIPGVAVIEQGTTNGTSSSADGSFRLNVQSLNATLQFSFVGMKPVVESLNGRTTVSVTMETSTEMVDEVVVTAMGIERDRKSLGYAISTIRGDQLTVAGNTQNPVMALYGKAAGVTIRQSASGPLGGININIRGAAGLQADAKTRPLFVVDGVPIFDENTGLHISSTDFGTGINSINPEDIESIDILKGAKASVLYGSEGANGVVLITTKKGGKIPDRLNVNVSYQTSIEQPLTFVEFQNKYGNGANIYDVKPLRQGETYPRANTAMVNYGPPFDPGQQRIWWDGVARPYVARPGNWEFLFNNGSNNTVNAAIDKSGEFGNVRLSFTNMDYKGVMENLWQKKNSVSFSGTFKLSNKLSVEAVANLFNINTHNRATSSLSISGAARDAPFQEFIETMDYTYTNPEDKNFGYKRDFETSSYPTGYYALSNYADLVWNRRNNSALDEKFHLIATVRPTYRITNWLSVTGQASIDYADTDFTNKNSVTRVYPNLSGGYYSFARRNTRVEEYKGLVNFYKSFVDDRLDVTAFAGTTYKSISDNSINVSTASVGSSSGFTYPNWYHLNNQNPAGWPGYGNRHHVYGNSFGENSLYGVFGVATLTWDSKYTIELNARNDWSSTLPPDNNSYFYPGVAFTYDATEVLQGIIPALQFGKFRASWADVGRDAPSRYYAYSSLSAGTVEGTDAQTVSTPASLFAGDLKPERKREFEIGTEMAFFKGNRLGLDLSVYSNNVYNQIMAVPLSQSTGATEIKINAGEVKNWGYEVQINASPVLTRNMRWDLTFTTANQFSEVVKLYPGITEKIVNSMRGKVDVIAKEGERIGNLYGTALLTDPSGNRIVGATGSAYALDPTKKVLLGNVFPNFMGGFNSTFSYKGFSVYAHFDYSFGASMFSESNQWLYYNGTGLLSLNYRDEENGGLAYYYDKNSNKTVKWEHNQSAPADAKDGRIYHDGFILNGVVPVTDASGKVTGYEKNTTIVPVSSYYSTFVSWANEAINAVDLKYKNDYIKLREVSVAYSLPRNLVQNLKVNSISIGLFARNIGYLYKTVPNLDAEAYMGTNTYFEAAIIPGARTMGMNVSVGF
jgi:TonB-linked SusC/RagA family outer membrane protein